MTDNSLLRDFVTETGDHLDEMKVKLSQLEKQPDDVSLMNDIFRSVHTIKGSSEYLGLENVSGLSHKLESLLVLMRRGEISTNSDVVDLLIGANDRIRLLVDDLARYESEKNPVGDLIQRINELTGEKVPEIDEDLGGAAIGEDIVEDIIYEDEHDEELFGIFVDQLKEGLQGLLEEVAQLQVTDAVETVFEQCADRLNTLRSSANYMGYEQLKDHYEAWMRQVADVRDQLATGKDVDVEAFIQTVMLANIERIKSFFPKVEELAQLGAVTPQAKETSSFASSFDAAYDDSVEETGFDMGTQSLLADFITETGEHLEDIERNLLGLEQQPDDIDIMNEIFRSIHTIKGSSEYLGLGKIAELSHKLENLLDLLRRGERQPSKEVVELLISANDRISHLVDDLDQHQAEKTPIEDLLKLIESHTGEADTADNQQEDATAAPVTAPNAADDKETDIIYEDEHDEELFSIFVEQLKEGLQELHDVVKQLKDGETIEPVLEKCTERLNSLRSSANYMGYEQLKDHYETWMRQVAEVRDQLAANTPLDLDPFIQSVMVDNIEQVKGYFPNVNGLPDMGLEQHAPEPPVEESVHTQTESEPDEEEQAYTSEIDMGEQSLLADFIAETGEHLEDTERNLLRLEQQPGDGDLMNEIFRSIHTIKGSSEYLGLVRIAELSHKLESLLDLLRRGEREAGKEVVELLITANDRISQLVDDLDQHKAEHASINDLLEWIEKLVSEKDDQQPGTETSELQPVRFDHGSTVYEETYDQELFGIFLTHLKDGLQFLRETSDQLVGVSDPVESLAQCEKTLYRLCSSANYMEYEELKDFLNRWLLALQETQHRLANNEFVDLNVFAKTSMRANIEQVYAIFKAFIEPQPLDTHIEEQNAEALAEQQLQVELSIPEEENVVDASPVETSAEETAEEDEDAFDEHNLIERLESAFDARLGNGQEENEQALPFDIEGQLLSEHQEDYSDDAFLDEHQDTFAYEEPAEQETDTLEAFLFSEVQEGMEEAVAEEATVEETRVEETADDEETADEDIRQELTSEEDILADETAEEPEIMTAEGAVDQMPMPEEEPIFSEASIEVSELEHTPVQPPEPAEPEIESYAAQEPDSSERRRSYQVGRRKADKFRDRMMKQSIRVEAGKIDYLMNQVGELVVNRAGFAQIFNDMRELQIFLKQTQKLDKKEMQWVKELTNRISDATLTLGRVTAELQENVMKVRMLPIAQLFSRYPRLVHDLVRNTQKKVFLDVRGEDTELDKMVIEQIADPMVHIIRNAVDHGIEEAKERQRRGKPETGTLRLEAYHEGNYVVIEISDDGRGIDLDKVKGTAMNKGFITQDELDEMDEVEILDLIMRPGFSTAEEITHTSGRGVGMDVVKDHIEKLSGTIEIYSTPGSGVRIKIKIPLTLAIIPALMVMVANEIFTIPLAVVDETIRVSHDEISTIEGLEVIQLREATIPLIRLSEVFKMESALHGDDFFVVIVNTGAKKVGFIVDQLRGREEVVIKPLEDYLQEKSGFSGATILGDGSISLILDVFELVNLSVNQHSNKVRAAAV